MKRHLRLTAALTLTFTLLVLGIGVQSQGISDSNLPEGDWTFSAHPYTGTGYDQRPVVVTATISDVTGMVIGVMLKNNSPNVVSAVKFGWSLMRDENRGSILGRGQTPFVSPSVEIVPGKYRQLAFPIVSFAKLSKQFVKGGTLSGDYRIEVAVSEVQYADGTTWVAKEGGDKVSAVKVAYMPRNLQCPGQTCDPGAPEEVCSNCIKSCINAICGNPMPTCPPHPQ